MDESKRKRVVAISVIVGFLAAFLFMGGGCICLPQVWCPAGGHGG